MCYYILNIISDKISEQELNNVAKKQNFTFRIIFNDSLQKQIASNQQLFLKNDQYCECNTILGKNHRSNSFKKVNAKILSDITKLKKKGWSDSKIQKWVKEKEKNLIDIENKTIDEFQHWSCFLNEVLKMTPRFGVLLHWFSGDISSEMIPLKKVVVQKIQNVSEKTFFDLDEDTLYFFE